MLIAEYARKRKLDGYNLHVRVPDEDANLNHYKNIFFKIFPNKCEFNSSDNTFIIYELEANLLYKYLYILNKFVLKCNDDEMKEYKEIMKNMCQKKLIKVDYRIFSKDSCTSDYNDDDIPREVLNEFSYLFTNICFTNKDDDETKEYITDEAFQEEKVEFEQERVAFEQEKVEFEQERVAFEQEKVGFEQEKVGFEQEKVEFEQERVAFEQEKVGFEQEKVGFEQEKVWFEQERVAFEQEKSSNIHKQEHNDDNIKNQFEKRVSVLNEKYEKLEKDYGILEQKLEDSELQQEYDNLVIEFNEYREDTEKQIEELRQYQPVDMSLYTKQDTTELLNLFTTFEKNITKVITENKDTSADSHRLRNTITSLEMENTELRKENEEIYEKLTFCERQFELIKNKYIKLQQLKHKYKTMVINSANTNHIDELPFISRRGISPIPDEPVRHVYKHH
jgi:hypothetical protein